MTPVKTKTQRLPGPEMDGKEFKVDTKSGGCYIATWCNRLQLFDGGRLTIDPIGVRSWSPIGEPVAVEGESENWPTADGWYHCTHANGDESVRFYTGGAFYKYCRGGEGLVNEDTNSGWQVTAWEPLAPALRLEWQEYDGTTLLLLNGVPVAQAGDGWWWMVLGGYHKRCPDPRAAAEAYIRQAFGLEVKP
jgi:hypothetical protein